MLLVYGISLGKKIFYYISGDIESSLEIGIISKNVQLMIK